MKSTAMHSLSPQIAMSTSTVGDMNSSIPRPVDAMTAKKVINALRRKVKSASPGVHIFYFNVFEEELERAYSLLDKEEQRRAMRSLTTTNSTLSSDL